MHTHAIHAGIVANGREHALTGEVETLDQRIERIERRYERMMGRAPWAARWVIMHRMRRRIRRARESVAPRDALYAMSTRRFGLGRPQRRREESD